MAIYNDYIAAAITYNFQLLPESLICGMIILSIVLVNQPLIVLAAGATGTQVLTSVVGKLIMRYAEGNAQLTGSKCAEVCSPGFLGKSWYRLLNGGRAPELLWHPIAPSVYLATIAFFVGVGLALLQIYKDGDCQSYSVGNGGRIPHRQRLRFHVRCRGRRTPRYHAGISWVHNDQLFYEPAGNKCMGHPPDSRPHQ